MEHKGTQNQKEKDLKKTMEQLGIPSVPPRPGTTGALPPRPTLPPVACENETIMSYRNQLSILVASGNCQKFLGKNFTFQDIDNMVPKEVERFYKIYEAKQASLINENITNSVINTYTKLCGYLFKIPDEEKLSNDLKSDFLVTTEIQNWAGFLSFKLGPVMTLLSASLITFSNIDSAKNIKEHSFKQHSSEATQGGFCSPLNDGKPSGESNNREASSPSQKGKV